jgi:hypothetical protein
VGDYEKAISVTTNDPEHGKVSLHCKGRVHVPLTAEPSRVSFGRVKRDEKTHYQTVTLVRGDAGPIQPEVVPFKYSGLEAKICEIEPGELYELEVSVGPPYPNDRFRHMLQLRTGVEEAPEMTLMLYGTMLERLAATPSRLLFPSEFPETVTKSVRLKWSSGPEGRILGATCNIPQADVQLEKDRSGNAVVKVTIPEGTKPITGTRELVVQTDDPELIRLKIPIRFQKFSARRSIARRSNINVDKDQPVRAATLQPSNLQKGEEPKPQKPE